VLLPGLYQHRHEQAARGSAHCSYVIITQAYVIMTDVDTGTGAAWERQHNEPHKAYAAFRVFRDMPAFRRDLPGITTQTGFSLRRLQELAVTWDWRERANTWDDACHRIEDAERLEAIRAMHEIHRKAGRAAIVKAMQALANYDASRMPISAVARLMELGAKLERSTVIVSVEELQGIEANLNGDDPWQRIADELAPESS
jgi:hypothetical protein